MVTNQGKRVDLEDMVKSPKGGNAKMPANSPLKNQRPHEAGKTGQFNENRPTKKIRSRPLDQPATSTET